MSGDDGKNETVHPEPLEPEDDNLTIDEYVELYSEFRAVLHNKEKNWPKEYQRTPIRDQVTLFKIWFIDMVDREMMRRFNPEDDEDEDDEKPNW